MNSRTKGIRTELKAKKELEKDGWLVYRVPASRMWQTQEDIMGLWDLLAIKPQQILFVQIKTNRKRNTIPHLEFMRKYFKFNNTVRAEVWVWRDYGRGFNKIGIK